MTRRLQIKERVELIVAIYGAIGATAAIAWQCYDYQAQLPELTLEFAQLRPSLILDGDSLEIRLQATLINKTATPISVYAADIIPTILEPSGRSLSGGWRVPDGLSTFAAVRLDGRDSQPLDLLWYFEVREPDKATLDSRDTYTLCWSLDLRTTAGTFAWNDLCYGVGLLGWPDSTAPLVAPLVVEEPVVELSPRRRTR